MNIWLEWIFQQTANNTQTCLPNMALTGLVWYWHFQIIYSQNVWYLINTFSRLLHMNWVWRKYATTVFCISKLLACIPSIPKVWSFYFTLKCLLNAICSKFFQSNWMWNKNDFSAYVFANTFYQYRHCEIRFYIYFILEQILESKLISVLFD